MLDEDRVRQMVRRVVYRTLGLSQRAGAAAARPLVTEVDVLCPCAKENQITRDNAADVKAAAIIEGANGPTTPEADEILTEKGVYIVPDILASAGGVIASYVEWRQAKSGALTQKDETFQVIEERVTTAFDAMLKVAEEKGCRSLRTASQVTAAEELVATMRDRDWI